MLSGPIRLCARHQSAMKKGVNVANRRRILAMITAGLLPFLGAIAPVPSASAVSLGFTYGPDAAVLDAGPTLRVLHWNIAGSTLNPKPVRPGQAEQPQPP